MRLSRLVLAVAACAVAPLAMAQSAVPASGVLITHVNSQKWEVRVISGNQADRFSGVFESNQPIFAVSGINAQGKTSTNLLASKSLGTTLSAGESTSFSVGTDASLCLRDTGSSGVQIYMGDSMVDAIPVTAPLALSGPDACSDVTGASIVPSLSV